MGSIEKEAMKIYDNLAKISEHEQNKGLMADLEDFRHIGSLFVLLSLTMSLDM